MPSLREVLDEQLITIKRLEEDLEQAEKEITRLRASHDELHRQVSQTLADKSQAERELETVRAAWKAAEADTWQAIAEQAEARAEQAEQERNEIVEKLARRQTAHHKDIDRMGQDAMTITHLRFIVKEAKEAVLYMGRDASQASVWQALCDAVENVDARGE